LAIQTDKKKGASPDLPGTTTVLEAQRRSELLCMDKERCSPLIGGATNSKMLD